MLQRPSLANGDPRIGVACKEAPHAGQLTGENNLLLATTAVTTSILNEPPLLPAGRNNNKFSIGCPAQVVSLVDSRGLDFRSSTPGGAEDLRLLASAAPPSDDVFLDNNQLDLKEQQEQSRLVYSRLIQEFQSDQEFDNQRQNSANTGDQIFDRVILKMAQQQTIKSNQPAGDNQTGPLGPVRPLPLTNSQRYRVINLAAPAPPELCWPPPNSLLAGPLASIAQRGFSAGHINPLATGFRCPPTSLMDVGDGQPSSQLALMARCNSTASQASSSTDDSSNLNAALRPDTTTGHHGGPNGQDGQEDPQVIYFSNQVGKGFHILKFW